MSTQVDASTIKAGQLFSTGNFRIPGFQRDYSWAAQAEVIDFWNDLSRAVDDPPYFLGLLILTDEDELKTVVDGQQRLVTLTLLANSIRKEATRRSKSLVADSMRDGFIYSIDYVQESRILRIRFASERDRTTFERLMTHGPDHQEPADYNIEMVKAQNLLDTKLQEDLERAGDAAIRLAKWAHFLSNGITFALFEHPDPNAAYKVFEVVNMRGKDLTPSQLIKNYAIGTASEENRNGVFERWTNLEESFIDIGAHSQFTQFIRGVITLRHGYVESRDLYQEIAENYQADAGIATLLKELEQHVDFYLQMVNPATDPQSVATKAFVILDLLGLRTIRPAFLAAGYTQQPDQAFEALLRIIVPRIANGTFGTGNVERRFAETAQDVFLSGEWRDPLERIRDLRPSRSDFENSVQVRPANKGVHQVVRTSALRRTAVPAIEGYIHQVRQRNSDDWPGFSDDDYRILGSTIGNYFISKQERRPRGTNSLDDVLSRLLPTSVDFEDTSVREARSWTANDVSAMSEQIAQAAAEVWYE